MVHMPGGEIGIEIGKIFDHDDGTVNRWPNGMHPELFKVKV